MFSSVIHALTCVYDQMDCNIFGPYSSSTLLPQVQITTDWCIEGEAHRACTRAICAIQDGRNHDNLRTPPTSDLARLFSASANVTMNALYSKKHSRTCPSPPNPHPGITQLDPPALLPPVLLPTIPDIEYNPRVERPSYSFPYDCLSTHRYNTDTVRLQIL